MLDQAARIIKLLAMSLRKRLLLAIALALLASFVAGTAVTAWQAATLVRGAMRAALQSGRHHAAAIHPGSLPDPAALSGLVHSFDDSADLRATLLRDGRAVESSSPAVAQFSAPAWFIRIATPALPPLDLQLGAATLRLTAEPENEIGERWLEARGLVGLLGLLSALAAGLTFAVTAWSLSPLAALGAAFLRLERGEAEATVAQAGPPEIARLAAGFNRMQHALRAAELENRRLAAQLARLAEEERAELARDLHDEMGPLLFAVTAWAAAARMQAQTGDAAAADASVAALERVAAELQGTLRDLLRRLRDSAPEPVDLRQSLEELMAFWRGVQPHTEFSLTFDAAAADAAAEPVRAVLFRVAQEGVSNAVRHGKPGRVRVCVQADAAGMSLRVRDDGQGGGGGGGFGLVGLQERLAAIGGRLEITQDHGWILTAFAPRRAMPAEAA